MQFQTTLLTTILALATFTVSAPIADAATPSIQARQTNILSGLLSLPSGTTEGDDAMGSGVATVGNGNGAAAGAANNGSTSATTSQCGLVDCSSGAAASENGAGGSSSTSTSGGIFKRVLDAVLGDSRQAR